MANSETSSDDKDEAPPIFTASDAKKLTAGIERLIEEDPPGIPGRIETLPEWIMEEPPFDVEQYFGIAGSDNGAQHYLNASLHLELPFHFSLLPKLGETRYDDWQLEDQELVNLAKVRNDLNYFLMLDEKALAGKYPDECRLLVSSFEKAFREMELAQSFPNRQLASSFDVQANSTIETVPRTAARILETALQGNVSVDSLIPKLKTCLKCSRDFSRLGSPHAQLNCRGGASVSIDGFVYPVLQKTSDPKRIAELIGILQEHLLACESRPYIVETFRHEYISLGQLLHGLESGDFKVDKEVGEMLSIPDDMPLPLAVHRILTTLAFYRINPAATESVIDWLAKEKGVSPESIREIVDAARKTPMEMDQTETMLLLPLVVQSVGSMTKADYQQELEILRARCHEAEIACKLDYPKRFDQLMFLNENWSIDPSWKKTKFLKWYLPQKFAKRQRGHDLKLRAVVSLAALRKWQLENNGQSPSDIVIALEAANVDPDLVMDPCSGKPFQLLNETDCAIYSVGPDQVDDEASPRLDQNAFANEEKGDVVFDLESAWE